VNEDPAEVVGILLHSIVESLDLPLVEEAQDPFLQLATALAGDYLDQPGFLLDCLVNDCSKGSIDVLTSVVDVVQIKF
jgi:hypothetical protein